MRLFTTNSFNKKYKKLIKRDISLEKGLIKTLRLIKKDIHHPSLRLHKLKGKIAYSVSIDLSLRIILSIKDEIIILVDIGTHDEVY